MDIVDFINNAVHNSKVFKYQNKSYIVTYISETRIVLYKLPTIAEIADNLNNNHPASINDFEFSIPESKDHEFNLSVLNKNYIPFDSLELYNEFKRKYLETIY